MLVYRNITEMLIIYGRSDWGKKMIMDIRYLENRIVGFCCVIEGKWWWREF